MTDQIKIEELDEGGALEAVNVELTNALENILDPNTEAKKERKVTLEIKFKGDENRNLCNVSYQAKTSLAPAKAQETNVLVDRDKKSGKATASELRSGSVPGQQELPTTKDGRIREMPNNGQGKE